MPTPMNPGVCAPPPTWPASEEKVIPAGVSLPIVVVLLFVAAYVRKRLRARRVMENWDPWEREDDPWQSDAEKAWEEEHTPKEKRGP